MDRAGTKREIIQSNDQNDGSPSTKRQRQNDNNQQQGSSQQQQQQQQQGEQGQQQFQTIQLRYPEQMQVGYTKVFYLLVLLLQYHPKDRRHTCFSRIAL